MRCSGCASNLPEMGCCSTGLYRECHTNTYYRILLQKSVLSISSREYRFAYICIHFLCNCVRVFPMTSQASSAWLHQYYSKTFSNSVSYLPPCPKFSLSCVNTIYLLNVRFSMEGLASSSPYSQAFRLDIQHSFLDAITNFFRPNLGAARLSGCRNTHMNRNCFSTFDLSLSLDSVQVLLFKVVDNNLKVIISVY